MVQCATGILRNEGPFAFYKVGRPWVVRMEIHLLIRNVLLGPLNHLSQWSKSLPWRPCCNVIFDMQGTLTPLLGIGVCVSIQFGALEYAKRVFAQRNVDQRVASAGPEGKVLTPTQLIASGAFAGIANGFVSGPVEHIRIRESPAARRRGAHGTTVGGVRIRIRE
jgi:hypothetical protein